SFEGRAMPAAPRLRCRKQKRMILTTEVKSAAHPFLFRGELHEPIHSLVGLGPCVLIRVPLHFVPLGIVVAVSELFSGRRTDQHAVLFQPYNSGCASER